MVFALHGALFVGFKAEEPLRGHMHSIALKALALPTVVVAAAYLVWMQLDYGKSWTWIPLIVAAVALIAGIVVTRAEHDGWAFALTCFTILGLGVLLFGSLFPDVLPSTSQYSGLDIYSAASSPYTLKVMTWAAVLFLPLVLVGQGWAYWSFRKRVRV